MERGRRIFFTAMLVLLSGLMIYRTVDVFFNRSEPNFQRWIKTMIGGTGGVLGCVYKILERANGQKSIRAALALPISAAGSGLYLLWSGL